MKMFFGILIITFFIIGIIQLIPSKRKIYLYNKKMPRHKYIGTTIQDTREENYIETKVSFFNYINSPKRNQIQKPTVQGALEEDRVNEMIKEDKLSIGLEL